MTTAASNSQSTVPFESLAELREAHYRLLKSSDTIGDAERLKGSILQFLEAGAALGGRLSVPRQRAEVQRLLDYWSSSLSAEELSASWVAALRRFVLAPCVVANQPEIAAAASEAVASFSPEKKKVARSVILRLLKLESDSASFSPISRSATELAAGLNAGATSDVIRQFLDCGLLREEDSKLSLSSPTVISYWPEARGWLADRRRLHGAAQFWNGHSRDSGALLEKGDALEEARSYLDLDDIEDTFVQTSVQKAVERENRQKRNTRLWLIGLTVLTIGFAISTIFTIAANVAAQKANRENVQLIERDKQRKLAEAELRLEQLQSTLAALTELKATLNQKLSPHETSEQQQVITKSIQDATQTINKAAKKQDEQAKTLAVTSAAKGSDKGWQNGTIAILDPQNDPRLKPDETLALVTTWKEANRFSPPIFKSNDGSRRPLVRNLDPNANWVASRWNYAITPRAWLLANKVTVRNPTTGKQVQAQPVDWGPSAGSGAIMNVSPGLAQFLGLANGGTADLLIPIPQLTK